MVILSQTLDAILKNELPTFIGYLTIPILIEWAFAKFVFKKNYSLREGLPTAAIGIIEVITTSLFLYWIYDFFKKIEGYSFFSFQKNTVYYIAVFIVAEFIFYISHRTSHHVRWFWNEHRVHHSSKDFNLFAGNRNGWTFSIAGMWIFSMPFVFLGFSWSDILWGLFLILNYQFFIHTELINKLGPLEYVINTPSLHRVHHGKEDLYLDKNFSGIFLIFDYLFKTLQRELPGVKATYGLRNESESSNIFKLVGSGWRDMINDFIRSPDWRSRARSMIDMKKNKTTYSSQSRTFESAEFILSPMSLSVFRMALGFAWLLILAYRLPEISHFYSNSGVLPVADALTLLQPERFSILYYFSSDLAVQMLFAVGMLSALGMILGYFSNICAFVSWIICVSLMNRSEVIISGGDMYMVVFLLLAAILPVNQFFSIQEQRALSPLKNKFFISGQLIYFIQIVSIYFFTGFLKRGSTWESGEALSIILQLKLTTKDLGLFLNQFPTFLSFLTYTVPWFEMSALVLLLPKQKFNYLKYFWIVSAISLHLGILLTMNVFYLPYMCIIALIPLIPETFWQRLFGYSFQFKKLSNSLNLQTLSPAIIAGLLIIGLNVHSSVVKFLPPVAINQAEKLRLDQYWNFFAPKPRDENNWWVISGVDVSGENWYWEKMGPTFADREPQKPIQLYDNIDWAVYFLGLTDPDYRKKLLPVFSEYLCRQSLIQSPEKPLARVHIELFAKRVSIQNQAEPSRIANAKFECADFQTRAVSSSEGKTQNF